MNIYYSPLIPQYTLPKLYVYFSSKTILQSIYSKHLYIYIYIYIYILDPPSLTIHSINISKY